MRWLLILCALPVLATAPTWEIQNKFALAHERWAVLRNTRVDNPVMVNNVDMTEFWAWQEVKKDWGQLSKQVDAEYRGER